MICGKKSWNSIWKTWWRLQSYYLRRASYLLQYFLSGTDLEITGSIYFKRKSPFLELMSLKHKLKLQLLRKEGTSALKFGGVVFNRSNDIVEATKNSFTNFHWQKFHYEGNWTCLELKNEDKTKEKVLSEWTCESTKRNLQNQRSWVSE